MIGIKNPKDIFEIVIIPTFEEFQGWLYFAKYFSCVINFWSIIQFAGWLILSYFGIKLVFSSQKDIKLKR